MPGWPLVSVNGELARWKAFIDAYFSLTGRERQGAGWVWIVRIGLGGLWGLPVSVFYPFTGYCTMRCTDGRRRLFR